MTPESDGPCKSVPFLVRRSEPMSQSTGRRLRYDRRRQISQVEVDGGWVDALDVPGDISASTRLTRVQAETTDDE